MIPRSVIAHEFRLSLRAGLTTREEIIQWADGVVLNEPYDDAMVDLCLATGATNMELSSMLAIIPARDEDKWDGMRRMLGRMHEALLREPGRLREFIEVFLTIFFENRWEVPGDFKFRVDLGYKLDMEYELMLAEAYNWDNTVEIRAMLLENLSQFNPLAGQGDAIHSPGPCLSPRFPP